MAREAGHFSIDDVLDRLSNKLVGRHPHVFGDVKADTPAEVLRNWEALKAQEKKKKRMEAGGEEKHAELKNESPSVLAGVSSRMPALLEAHKLSSRAAHVGFDWPEIEGLFEKLAEETAELREELKAVPHPRALPETGVAGIGQAADFAPNRASAWKMKSATFFSCSSTSRASSRSIPNPRCARPTASSSAAFNGWKSGCDPSGRGPQQASMDELEELWQQSKRQEKRA